jgi:hypothetical protein
MVHDCTQIIVNVVRLGVGLNASDVFRALGIANQAQRAFRFKLDPVVWPISERYLLPNSGYELDTALEDLRKTEKYRDSKPPIVAFSAFALGDVEYGDEPEYFYFCSTPDADPLVTTVSTYPLKFLPKRTLQDYTLLMLATNILSTYGDMHYHDETRGCLLDYCEDLTDAEKAFEAGKLCESCEKRLEEQIKAGRVTLDIASAAIKILHRAVGRSYCFVAMHFGAEFDYVYNLNYSRGSALAANLRRSFDLPSMMLQAMS